jgi:integrase
MTWERFRELFEEEYLSGLRHLTQRGYDAMFDSFERMCRPTRLRSINERTISRFVAGMRAFKKRNGKVGMEAVTIKMRLNSLHAALTWANKQKLIPAVPNFPDIKVPKRRPSPVPAESVDKLLAKADPHMRTFLACGWFAGLRLSEALMLERDETTKAPWLDLDRERIVLPADFVKADEDQWVPLDPELRAALLELPRRGRRFFHFEAQSGEPIGATGVNNRITALARKAGVKLTMKILRRGFGCRYAAKVSAHVLQRLMRHSDIKVTMAYYANIDEAVEEAVLGPGRNRLRNGGAGKKTHQGGTSTAKHDGKRTNGAADS